MIPKFKVWDKKNKKMLYQKDLEITFSDYGIYVHNEETYRVSDQHIHDFELLQSTGLKDNNGTEIYEGDIVTDMNGEIGYTVFLKQEMGYVIVYKNRDRRLGHRNGIDDFHLKIIGNIYQHPHLLEED